MRRSELRDEIELRMEDTENTIAEDPQINRWINDAIKEIAREEHWPFLKVRENVTATAASSTVDLPTNCRIVTKVNIVAADNTRTPLRPAGDRWIQEQYDVSSQGTPYYYTNGGFKQTANNAPPTRVLRLVPTPEANTTLEITYLRKGNPLTSDDAYPPFPEEFDEAIILLVLKQYWRQVDATDNVALIDATYKDEMRRLKLDYAKEFHEELPRIAIEEDGAW